jgi:hypothetical protein
MGSALGYAADVEDRLDAGSPNQSRKLDLVRGSVPECKKIHTACSAENFVAFRS